MKATSRALVLLALAAVGLVGCGTTRMTDTARSATEQLLVSQAIDNAINRLDFAPLAGKEVFFEEKCLDGAVDKGYLTSSLRQHLLAAGAVLVEEKAKATYVVEARSGCVGTDKQTFLVGVPQMQLPSIVPGTPPAIPEIPVMKSTDQRGVAKVAVFAYNRKTGRAIWQSGVHESTSKSKDAYVLGFGPFHKGTVNKDEDNTMQKLDVLGVTETGETRTAEAPRRGTDVTQTAYWQEVPSRGAAGNGTVTVGATGAQAGTVKQAGGPAPKK